VNADTIIFTAVITIKKKVKTIMEETIK